MKKISILLLSMLTSLTLWAAPSQTHTYPKWLDNAAIYHIYPSSFMDSNGDGYGDLEGIRSKLEYIKSVGFNTIWLSPIFCTEFEDGGYDITDYYKIDPRFGTNSDLVRLVEDAHSKGIRVCLDLVAGHTSDKHPWFQESANGDKHGHYADYYIWTHGKDYKPAKPNPQDKGDWVDNNYPRNGYYLKNFYDVQPALNFGFYNPNPEHPWEQAYDAPGPKAVRQEMKNILSFWFDKGVDGFRCDMAWSLVKCDDAEFSGVRRLWNEIFEWKNKNYPETIFLSEWSSPIEAISCGFDIDIIRHNGCGKIMYRDLVYNTEPYPDPATGIYPPRDCWFDKDGKGRFDTFVVPFEEMYKTTKGDGFPCMPISSHDTWRINREDRSSIGELKTAMAFFLTMPWVPIVYYGEEIGMRSMDGVPFIEGSGKRSAERTPMQWSEGATAGFSTCDPSKLYLPIDTTPNRPEVASQENDPSSMLSWTKGLLALRREIKALGNTGAWKMVSNPHEPYPVIYERGEGSERYLVVLNPRHKAAEATIEGNLALQVIYGEKRALQAKRSGANTRIKIAGASAVICKIE